ncbi:MAG: TonB-dependent receptor [Acidobacteria bacterium]|nr:TonB-dependent receptor [Acidobacteriota bacterium]
MRVVFSTLWVLVICSQLALAQVNTATISGVVQDASGAVIPGVSVTVRNQDTGISRTVTTDAGGRYRAPNLSLGNYEVEAQTAGFQTEVRIGITLTVGRTAVVDMTLSVGAITERVEVTAEAPLVETTNATVGSLVDGRTITDMPLNGRSYDQLALLQTTVVAYGGGVGSGFGFGAGTRMSVAGGRTMTNSYLLDGTDINDHGNGTPGGGAGSNLGVDAIREFKIITNAFAAEYGRASGAVISTVTKSGTNSFHGSVFEFHRNDELDAAEYGFFDDPENNVIARPPFVQNQFGGVIGGPIVRDRTFFFAAYEGLRKRRGEPNVPIVPSAAGKLGFVGLQDNGTPDDPSDDFEFVDIDPRIMPFLNLYPTANDPASVAQNNNGTGNFITAPSVATRQDYLMGRVDHTINNSHTIFGRYTLDDDEVATPDSIPAFLATAVARRQYATVQLSSVLSPTVLNSFRVAFNRSAQANDDLPVDDLGPDFSFIPGLPMGLITMQGTVATISGRGISNLGPSNTVPRVYVYSLFEYGDDLSVIKGRHSLKFGGSLKRMRDNHSGNTTLRGRYRFGSFPEFLAGVPNRFEYVLPLADPRADILTDQPGLSVGHAYRGFRQYFYAVYAQDDFQISPRLTLNLGLRYETVTNPREVNGLLSRLDDPLDPFYRTDVDSFILLTKKTFQPRFGFAWQMNDSGRTVLRGGTGIFHDQFLPVSYGTQSSKYPPFFNAVRSSAGETNFTRDDLLGGEIRPRITGNAPVGKMATKYHWNVTLQQQLGESNVVELGYIGSRALYLGKFAELNTPIPVILSDGRQCFSGSSLCPEAKRSRRNPVFDELRTIQHNATSLYNAFTFKFTRRANSGPQYQFLYTFSRAMDNGSTTATGDFRREPQTGLDPYNPNRDHARSSFDVPHNFTVTYSYPLPFQFEGGMANALLGGWSFSGITNIQSGGPFNVRTGSDQDRNRDGGRSDRPDLTPGANNNPISGSSSGCGDGAIEAGVVGTSVDAWSSSDRWYDPCAFTINPRGIYGNLGRNTLIGPGKINFDFSVHKEITLGETSHLQFRAEFFNLFNRNNLGLPENIPFDRQAYEPSAGTILPGETVTRPREIQFGLKIIF